tara:strand:+ start:527 stop:766 length:240 start_codon:yes stop_codon:yes gene_type:complete
MVALTQAHKDKIASRLRAYHRSCKKKDERPRKIVFKKKKAAPARKTRMISKKLVEKAKGRVATEIRQYNKELQKSKLRV